MSDLSIKIKDTVSLEHGSYNVWSLYYYNLKGRKTTLAEFTQGPLQAVLMIAAARAAVKWKLLDDFDIVADEVQMDRLKKLMPDLVETPPTTAPNDEFAKTLTYLSNESKDLREEYDAKANGAHDKLTIGSPENAAKMYTAFCEAAGITYDKKGDKA